jgi:hypothetical protein
VANLAACGRYFQQKASQWIAAEGSVEAHVRRLGKEGLANEFRADMDFGEVCQYFLELGDVQYVHELEYVQLRSQVLQSLKGQVGDRFGSRLGGELNTIISAASLACGFTAIGQRLVRIVGALPRSQ